MLVERMVRRGKINGRGISERGTGLGSDDE